MSKVDKTPGYFCTVNKTLQTKISGVMREFLLNAMGYATVVAMIVSVVYTWSCINREIRKMEKAK